MTVKAHDPLKWGLRCRASSYLSIHDIEAAQLLKAWAVEARVEMTIRSKEGRRKAAATWRMWVEEQWKQGAGALHLFTKMTAPAADEAGGL